MKLFNFTDLQNRFNFETNNNISIDLYVPKLYPKSAFCLKFHSDSNSDFEFGIEYNLQINDENNIYNSTDLVSSKLQYLYFPFFFEEIKTFKFSFNFCPTIFYNDKYIYFPNYIFYYEIFEKIQLSKNNIYNFFNFINTSSVITF